ncbi:magnesium/cobalt transporter CorA [Rhodocaloribacter litoris]|uniref:magnesium/cobalt transporter CorA n=1 Tax=Rhodocaloribacter litoris TaxID=2558931 RepID=UPI00142209CF|nr:magnesium/cobalt transporter CorA [Rhodocaloribacter litoris]QXD14802.1 magnesium/cobalt transporter CorA [Rhodocaloribacter litoris]
MPRYLKKRSKKLGLPPGTLVPLEERTEPVTFQVFDYGPDTFAEHTFSRVDEVLAYRDSPTVTWINVDGVHDVEVIRRLGEHFGLHPLVQEDIASTEQRPKVEPYEDYLFIVVRMLRFNPARQQLDAEQVSLIVGTGYVLSFQERPGDVLDPVRHRLRNGLGRLRRNGADYLAYALLDVIVDHYFVALEQLSERIEELEEDVLRDPSLPTQQHIRDLRRELILMRRSVWPLRELFLGLERIEAPLIRDETRPFLRDAYDHSIQVIDIVESLREILAGLMDLYLSSLSNRMNEVMKFLTIMGTIFIPLTFIAGIYGMNFDYMPELHFKYGYPLVMAFMLGVGLALVVYFRRKRWL